MIGSLFPEGVAAARACAEAWTAPLLAGEAARVAGASDARRREFAAGRRCAREALAKLGFAETALPADADRVPRWPAGAVGSISHSGGHCAAVAALRRDFAGLGLDLERCRPLGAGVARRIAGPAERARMAALPPLGAAGGWPLLLFSAKESFYKCYFPLARTRLGFRDVEVELRRDGTFTAALVRAEAVAAAGARRCEGRWLAAGAFVATGAWLPA